jgi:hypothetical protein
MLSKPLATIPLAGGMADANTGCFLAAQWIAKNIVLGSIAAAGFTMISPNSRNCEIIE